MKSKLNFESRIMEVVQSINAHLPDDYRRRLEEEERRTQRLLELRNLNRRHILIVGGAGYIGSVLVGHLLERGYKIRCLDFLLYNNRACIDPFLLNSDFEFIVSDHVNPRDLASALEGITDVILLGGLVGDPITKKYPKESKAINRDGYIQMPGLLNGRGLNKVVFVSTCSNYGLVANNRLADEESELNPLSGYARAKVAVEKKFLSLGGSVDFHPTVLRFATAFGLSPRMRFDLTISQFTRAIALGHELHVYDPDTWRPYCHVQDFSEVIRRVIEAPLELVSRQIFNAGGDDNNFTKRMIVDAVLNERPDGTVDYQRHGSDPRNYRVNFSKIRSILHFEPRHSVADGIRELLAILYQGEFADINSPPSFHGNYDISYTV